MIVSRILVFAILLFLPSSILFSQKPLEYFLPSGMAYDPAIPTPQSYFGFQVGEWHLTPEQIHSYIKTLDAVSDRITLMEFGRTYEERPMLLLTITSPENHADIERIREEHLRLSNPSGSASVAVDRMPVVIWMGYSVHGNESSGSNASVLVAYYLAAAQGAAIEKTLREAVILLNPSINPDGLNRFATWANMHKGRQPVADPANREHNEVWPGGRGNHYWFDLNRDWMPVQHPESQGRIDQYYRWRPNVLTDHHEMGTGSTFFFQPGVASRENPLTPPEARALTARIAQFHEKALNQAGSLYYSEEGFDDFYVGKGSSYPDITGGIGILFEQASSRGHVQESSNGLVDFPFTIRNQVITSLSSLAAAQALRIDLLNHQRAFFSNALRDAERTPVKAYVFGSPSDRARTLHLVDLLRRHQITVHPLAKSVRANGNEFRPEFAFVVPTGQTQFRLLSSLFDKRTSFSDSLFYDISTWTLPLAFGIPWSELRSVDRTFLGTIGSDGIASSGVFKGQKNSYAYVFEWSDYYAPRALNRLLRAGVIAKVATKAFQAATADGLRSFDHGTILLPLSIQTAKRDTINALIDRAVLEDNLRVYALQTGSTPSGIDLGSSDFVTVKPPSIALVAGTGVPATDIGEAWHLLDQRIQMDITLLEPQSIARTRLDRYTAIVIAGGSAIDSAGKSTLRQWVQNGGTLLAFEQGAEWAIANKLSSAKVRPDAAKKDSVTAMRPYESYEKYTRALAVPGTIFETQYDNTHPLLYGYAGSPMHVLRTGMLFLEPSSNPFATPVRYTQNPLVSGYLNPQHAKRVAGSAAVVVSALQSGRVIVMSDNPNFRAFWFGTNRLFLNGLFFGSVISAPSARTEEQNQ
ncbi:MAG: M14 family metallopeptidase [Bacteroidota bacterium]